MKSLLSETNNDDDNNINILRSGLQSGINVILLVIREFTINIISNDNCVGFCC